MEAQIDLLCSKLSRRQIKGSLEVTIETSKLLRNVIAGSRWNDADSLTTLVKQVQQRLTEAQPIEFSSEHTARRILNLIHDDTMEWDRREEEEEMTTIRSILTTNKKVNHKKKPLLETPSRILFSKKFLKLWMRPNLQILTLLRKH